MSENKKPTMKDVARLADVSVQTVSTIINGRPGISEETTFRVQKAIKDLGYRPFSVARSLRTRETKTIALVVSDIANPSFATMASAAEDYAHKAGYSLVLYNTHDDTDREANYMRTAIERWVDGVVFVSAKDQMASLVALQAAGIPSVAVDRIPEGYEGYSVTLDNVEAGRLAAEHLLDLGHTCIAHISGPLELRLSRERLVGFRNAIEARGYQSGPCIENQQGNWVCSSGYSAMKKLLLQREGLTAVFAANDRMAIGAMQAIYEAGLRIPEDISVVGLDDIEVAAFQIPPLTTVRQSFAQLATLGVQLLSDILAGKEIEQEMRIIKPELIIRKSTCPTLN